MAERTLRSPVSHNVTIVLSGVRNDAAVGDGPDRVREYAGPENGVFVLFLLHSSFFTVNHSSFRAHSFFMGRWSQYDEV